MQAFFLTCVFLTIVFGTGYISASLAKALIEVDEHVSDKLEGLNSDESPVEFMQALASLGVKFDSPEISAFAARTCNRQVYRFLLQQESFDPKIEGFNGFDALHAAADKFCIAGADELLNSGRVERYSIQNGFTILHRAVFNDAMELAKYLLFDAEFEDIPNAKGRNTRSLAKSEEMSKLFMLHELMRFSEHPSQKMLLKELVKEI